MEKVRSRQAAILVLNWVKQNFFLGCIYIVQITLRTILNKCLGYQIYECVYIAHWASPSPQWTPLSSNDLQWAPMTSTKPWWTPLSSSEPHWAVMIPTESHWILLTFTETQWNPHDPHLASFSPTELHWVLITSPAPLLSPTKPQWPFNDPWWAPMTHNDSCLARKILIWSQITIITISNKCLRCQIYLFLVNIYLSSVFVLHNRSYHTTNCIKMHIENPQFNK